MSYDPHRYRRKSNRAGYYDYSLPGWYFLTVTTADRAHILGTVVDGRFCSSVAGDIVREEWLRTPDVRSDVDLDAYVIMPNHIHGIVVIREHPDAGQQSPLPRSFQSPSVDIGAIVRGFKAASTKRINEVWGTTSAKVWQRNYYDRIIRDETELERIRAYIENNPLNWESDQENA